MYFVFSSVVVILTAIQPRSAGICFIFCVKCWLCSVLLPLSLCLCLCLIPHVLGRWRDHNHGSVPALEAATTAARQPSLAAADGLVRSTLLKSVAELQSARDYTV